MDVDPMEAVEPEDEDDSAVEHEKRKSRLNSWVAITVALLATFMGICKVKDDNIVQAMQQAQADKIDNWSFYQARNIRQEIGQSTLSQLTITRLTTPREHLPAVDSAIARAQALIKDQASKKDSLRAAAEGNAKQYDALNYRDD